MTVLAVAALSARMLAEAARDDGFDVVALDLFGDADTRRACSQWLPIGQSGSLRLDATRLLSALDALARRGGVTGWIAGSGFEGQPDLLERGAALLPLIGTQPGAVRRVRDPRQFFGLLAGKGIAHPAVQMTPPADAAGWLVKDAGGCGGWHIHRATPQRGHVPAEPAGGAAGARRYFQREMPGAPMSATFIANGHDGFVLGFNQLIVRRFGTRPFVFCGAVGPVPMPAEVAGRLDAAVRALAAAFSLRGLGSLDFMLDGGSFSVLEVNPRPPGSMALYGKRCLQGASQSASPGVVAAHVRACLEGELPQPPAQPVHEAVPATAVGGTEIVFAPRTLWLDEPGALRLAARDGCHDLPAGATRFEAGDPVCSVSARGANAEQVRRRLDRGREAVHRTLETGP